jgi:hypothetical protein
MDEVAELSPLAAELLTSLGSTNSSAALEIGGGIALWTYSPHRKTNDIDAWWKEPYLECRKAIEASVALVAANNELTWSHRSQSGSESWDLRRESKTVFAFQVAIKTRPVESPLPSVWGALKIESLRENLANKMSALVQRGAPRDLVDIATLLRKSLTRESECWTLWRLKNPEFSIAAAKSTILKHLSSLASRRPLTAILDAEERHRAETVRKMVQRLAEAGGALDEA